MKMQESGDNEEGTSTRSGNLISVKHNSTTRHSNSTLEDRLTGLVADQQFAHRNRSKNYPSTSYAYRQYLSSGK